MYNLLRIVTTRVVVPEQVSTGLNDWLKATGDEMEMIDGISFVWNDTREVSVDADENGPILPFPLNVDGNEDESIILSAGGSDDVSDASFTAVGVLRILNPYNDDPKCLDGQMYVREIGKNGWIHWECSIRKREGCP